MRLDPQMPKGVSKRVRRRRLGMAMMAGTVAAGVAVGAFLGVQALRGTTPPPNQLTNSQGTYEVWFTLRDHLFVAPARVPTADAPRGALESLLRGPNDKETSAGVGS